MAEFQKWTEQVTQLRMSRVVGSKTTLHSDIVHEKTIIHRQLFAVMQWSFSQLKRR